MPDPTVPLIPLEDFFENPERAGVKMSPDGTRLSYLAPENGRLNVWVQTIGKDDAVCVTHDHTRGIPGYFWSRDGKRILYVQDQGGNENFRVYAADPADPDAPSKDLTPFDGVRVMLVDAPKATPDKVLIAMNKRNPQLFDVHRLDLGTSAIEDVADNPGDVGGWLTDPEGRLRCAVAQTPDGGSQLRVRDSEEDDFRVLANFTNEDDCLPFGFTADGTGILIGTAQDAEFKRLCKIDIATAAITVVDEHPSADLSGGLISDKTHELLGAIYVTDEVEFHAHDPAWGKTWEQLKALHHGDPNITGMDDDERKTIVTFDDDRDPGAVYFFDRETGASEFLFRMRPKLNPEHLAEMKPVSYTARDGLKIHAYLTTPVGIEPKGLPLILLVHGGPWARDMWGYDPEAQFLANRGYAVLQINYRGSSGYGKAFTEAAVKQFAGAMHDDLIDGVDWAVSEGIADREKVAIYGGSYGGYATLVGVTFTPDVFRCAISYVGPSSLITLVESFPEYWKPFLAGTWFKFVGDPSDPEQRKDLEARSPLNKVDAIKTPLMVVQGANDPRVTKVESDQIVEALQKKGVDVEYIVADDEGHGFSNPENKLRLYRAMEQFFSKHLGGRTS